MSLWADKYRPKDISKLDYHKEQALDLKNLTKDGDFPHLLVYGPMGAGKKTRVNCLLRELFGAGVEKVSFEDMHFTTPSNKKIEITTIKSNFHIEVNPSDVGRNDRVVIMELIKQMAQTQQIDMHGQRPFKVIILADVDDLTLDAQHALRRTMEKYVASCRIILCATSISRVIPAIRSRCVCIRVPAPSQEDVTRIIMQTASMENIDFPKELAQKIAVKSERNLRRALLMSEACRVENEGSKLTPNSKIAEPDWRVFIVELAALILAKQDVERVAMVRENMYELLINGIPHDIIFKTLLEELIKKCDQGLTPKVVEQAAIYEHRLVKGNKAIFHLEAFVCKFMTMYQEYMVELFGGDDGDF